MVLKKRFSKVAIGLIFAMLVITALAGCGSNNTSANNSVKVIKVGLVADNAPFSFLTSNNEPSGYDGELLQLINKQLKGYKFEYSALSQSSLLVGLATGKFDLASSHFYKSQERAAKYLLSGQPTGLSDVRLIIRKNETAIHSLNDLHTNKLAPISTDDARYSIIDTYNKNHPNNKIDLVGIGDQNAADPFKAIVANQYDAAIYPLAAFTEVQSQLNLNLKTTATIDLVPTYFLYNKQSSTDQELQKQIDKILKEFKQDGTLEKLSKKWYKEDVYKIKPVN